MPTQRIEVIDAEPGRVRFHVPGLWQDPERARDIRRSLDAYPGVLAVKLGLFTSNVTVDYEPDEAEEVLDLLEQLFPGSDFGTLKPGRHLLELEVSAGTERRQRPSRDAARARARAKRRGVATVGFAVAGIVAGIIAGRILGRK